MRRFITAAGLVLLTHSLAPAQSEQAHFPDTPANHWVYQAKADLQSAGFLTGYPDGLGPGVWIMTRVEMAVAVNAACARIASFRPAEPGEATLPFPDVPSTHWASAAVKSLRSIGVVHGYEDRLFRG